MLHRRRFLPKQSVFYEHVCKFNTDLSANPNTVAEWVDKF